MIAPAPLPASTVDIGAALLANETFLRSNVDQAIASLTADGTIEAILKATQFPADSREDDDPMLTGPSARAADFGRRRALTTATGLPSRSKA